MAGLLAAHHFSDMRPKVIEAQAQLPDNHRALLRFRSDSVSTMTGIPFRKVRVQKAIIEKDGTLTSRATLLHQNSYAYKVTGQVIPRSIMNLEPGDRFIAPDDFMARLADGCDITFGRPLTKDDLSALLEHKQPILSTIPMPALMEMEGWEDVPAFERQAITSVWVELDKVDIYQTVYNPWLDGGPYRVSFTGRQMILEYIDQPQAATNDIRYFCDSVLGFQPEWREVPKFKRQPYGKIVPCDDKVRRQFIMAMTDMYGIYSVGRFATWRQLLLDDVVKDLMLIRTMIRAGSAYERRLHYSRAAT